MATYSACEETSCFLEVEKSSIWCGIKININTTGRNFLVTAETEGDSDETPSCPPVSSASLKACCFSVPSWIFRPRDDPQPAAGCLQENRMWTFKSVLKRFMTVGDIVQSCYWACIQGEHWNSWAAQTWVGNLLAWRGQCFSVKPNSNLLLIRTDGYWVAGWPWATWTQQKWKVTITIKEIKKIFF